MVMLFSLLFTACQKEKQEVINIPFDKEHTPTMRATNVATLISDSGIIRYGLKTKEWLVFDKAKEPFWKFPKGAYVEKFDTLHHIEASIEADTAYYWSKKEFWKLIGNVKVRSLKGEQFDTELLYWDQKKKTIYSDSFIKIEQHDKVITGIGFKSNQDMTDYKIFESKGIFPIEEKAPIDSTQEKRK